MPLRLRTGVFFASLLFFTFLPQAIKAIPTYGLVLYYDFETINGTNVADESGNGNEGQLMGQKVVDSGHTGQGVRFTTADDYLLMPEGVLNNLTSYSITAWVNLASINGWSRVFDFGSGTANNLFFTPSASAGFPRAAIKLNNGAEQIINADVQLNTNTWTHIALTFSWNSTDNKGVGRLYINGELAGSNANMTINPSMLPTTTQNYLAKSQYNDPALNGAIDAFALYSRSLSDAEVMESYGFTPDMIAAFNGLTLQGDLNSITDNLVLPTVTGSQNFPVTWSSNMPDVITSDGTVTRLPLYDQLVVLTATISMPGDVSVEKVFNLTVLAMESKLWRSLVLETDTFRYLVATSEPPTAWYTPDFNDAAWPLGIGGFGFADNDDNTVVARCNSIYLRRQFTVNDLSQLDRLVLDIDYDDAFVAYLNGVPVAYSSNVSGPYQPYNGTVSRDHEAQLYRGGYPERITLNPALLVNGLNTLAVQVLNLNLASTDLSARVFLHTRLQSAEPQYQPVPAWFQEPMDLGMSDLPIIMINTNGQVITEFDKITADMKVLNNPSGDNRIDDTLFEYDGKIGFRHRGFSSLQFPKKNFSVETRDELGENLNVPLLGMPKENDWVFHGPYSDKSLMRNVLAYHLGNLTGTWSPRTRFFEFYLNDAYQGLYVLVEKIKIDKDRLDLAKLKPEDVDGDQVTGGYILKLDRPDKEKFGNETEVEGTHYWISPYRARTSLKQKEYFILHHPKGDNVNVAQFTYIKEHITAFEDALNDVNNFTDKEKGYYPLVDFPSFVDYYILTELSRNLDGYRISTFLHKEKDSKGGKIKMGPYWDYNLCFGNANFFGAGNPNGWVIDGMGNADQYAMPFWWETFRLDPYFNSELKKSWNNWRANYLNSSYLNQFIDSCATVVYDAQKRNFQKWNVLGTYVWPNNYVGNSYANEVNYLKTWLASRISWMDSQIQALVELPNQLTAENFPMDLITTPNPFTSDVTFRYHLGSPARVRISVYDLMGRLVYNHEEMTVGGFQEHHLNAADLGGKPSVYLYRVSVNEIIRKTGKLILEAQY